MRGIPKALKDSMVVQLRVDAGVPTDLLEKHKDKVATVLHETAMAATAAANRVLKRYGIKEMPPVKKI